VTHRLLSLVAVGLLASLAACGDGETNVAPTTSVAPTTAEEQPSSDVEPFPTGEPVDLVYISDSGGWGVAERYAELASEALGREVRLHDHRIGGMSMSGVLALVRGSLADEVAEAEIIVLYAQPRGLEYNLPQPNILTCFEALDALEESTSTLEWDPPVVPLAEDWQPYRDVLDEVYGEIWRLREGRPVVLRAHDIYNGFIAPWRELGIEPECTANWEVEMQVIREAAEANGAVFVSFFDVFNGSEHDKDPREKGWIQDDGMHANDEGGSVAAEALAAVGFRVSEPPS